MLRLNEGTGSYTAQKTGKVDHHFNPLRIAGEYLIIPNATKANVHDGLMRWCRNKQVVCLHLCFPRQSKIVALEKSAGGSMKVYLRSWQPPR